MTRSSLCCVAILSQFVFGCAELDSKSAATPGDLGRVEFAYRDWFVTYPLDLGLLPGSVMSVDVSGPANAPGVTANSSDEAVATFRIEAHCGCTKYSSSGATSYSTSDGGCAADETRECSNEVYVSAVAPGDAKLELRDPAGTLLDTTDVHVRRAAAGSIEASSPDSGRYAIRSSMNVLAGNSLYLDAHFTDEGGKALLGDGAVRWSVDDPAVAGLANFFSVSVTGVSPGTTRVHARAPGADAAAEITVTAR